MGLQQFINATGRPAKVAPIDKALYLAAGCQSFVGSGTAPVATSRWWMSDPWYESGGDPFTTGGMPDRTVWMSVVMMHSSASNLCCGRGVGRGCVRTEQRKNYLTYRPGDDYNRSCTVRSRSHTTATRTSLEARPFQTIGGAWDSCVLMRKVFAGSRIETYGRLHVPTAPTESSPLSCC